MPKLDMQILVSNQFPFSWCHFCPHTLECTTNERDVYSRRQLNCVQALLNVKPTPECEAAIQRTPAYYLHEIISKDDVDLIVEGPLLDAFYEITHHTMNFNNLDQQLKIWYRNLSIQWKR